MFEGLLHEIEKSPIICVFRHLVPDADALGSQWGLVQWLKETYPAKQIYALGETTDSNSHFFPSSDVVSDEIISQSLAIVLDTANAKRVDDGRFTLAKMIIKIDHHPQVDDYAMKSFVDDYFAATCEMIATFLKSVVSKPLSKTVATYLYAGLLTDTLNFSTNNTSAKTLRIASYLAQSDISFTAINEQLFAISREEFLFSNYIRSQAVFRPCGLVYVFITLKMLHEFNITPVAAKERITDFGLVREFEVWVLFIEVAKDEVSYYNGSIRSKHVIINDIAARYNGGGHRHAAAVKGCTMIEAQTILDELCQRLQEAKTK